MAIYKLGDLLISKPIYGANLKALKKGKYKYFRQSDLSKKPSMFVNKTHNKIMKKGDFFISRAGTIDTYLHNNNEKYVYAGYIVKYPINSNLTSTKYIYYWSKGVGKKQIQAFCNTGSTMPKLNPPIALQLKINLPSINTQQQIIDIIEPHEKLFLNYSNCVRIDTLTNAKQDMKTLIDIIEPIEMLIDLINKLVNKIKLYLIKKYQSNKNKLVLIENIGYLSSRKWVNQTSYYATNGIGEFSLDNNKIQNVLLKKPSRANLTPQNNSFIISKLIGENKIYFITNEKENVFSTGFFNIITKYIDHLSGFILSNDFKKQKDIYSSGTTMIGLNNKSFAQIKIKKPMSMDGQFTYSITKLLKCRNKFLDIKEKTIRLLIK